MRSSVFVSWVAGLSLVLSLSGGLAAQDFTLSQVNTVGQVFNPALTGSFSEEARVVSSFRNQWFASGYPYQTFLLSAEYKHHPLPKKLKQVAYAFHFADDQVGGGQWRNSWLSLGASASKSLDDARRHTLSFGLSSALLLRQFNARNLIFESQFESSSFTFNPEIASGENLGPVRQGFFQVNSGLFYHFAFSDRLSFGAGGSVFWLYKPQAQLTNLQSSQTARMNRRATSLFTLKYRLLSGISLEPQVFFSHQGKAVDLNLGSWLVFSNAFFGSGEWQMGLGLFSRMGDALIPAFRLGKGKMYGQLSYDATLSGASQADRGNTFAGIGGMGALEFSFVYGFNLKPTALKRITIPCQTF